MKLDLTEFWNTTAYDCGQAAATTVLVYYGVETSTELVSADYPPNLLFGFLGTGRRRVEAPFRDRRWDVRYVWGEDELKGSLDAGKPVILSIGFPVFWILPGGHWTVAYGYDDEGVTLSNWGEEPWDDFRRKWRGVAPTLAGLRGGGIVASPPETPAKRFADLLK